MRKRRKTEAKEKAEELESTRLRVATDNLAVLAQARLHRWHACLAPPRVEWSVNDGHAVMQGNSLSHSLYRCRGVSDRNMTNATRAAAYVMLPHVEMFGNGEYGSWDTCVCWPAGRSGCTRTIGARCRLLLLRRNEFLLNAELLLMTGGRGASPGTARLQPNARSYGGQRRTARHAQRGCRRGHAAGRASSWPRRRRPHARPSWCVLRCAWQSRLEQQLVWRPQYGLRCPARQRDTSHTSMLRKR